MPHMRKMKTESFVYSPPQNSSRILITVDHATNIVPDWVNGGDLGIAVADMNRHIAYDVGALGVAQAMAKAFDAHLLASQFSRLVIDPNRGDDDPTMIMRIYDRTIIPANRELDDAEREARLERLYRPYHAQYQAVLDDIRANGHEPIIIAIHSFTPQLRGRPLRPWHIGILSANDRRIAGPLIRVLEAQGDLVVGDNEPYRGALKGDSLDAHGILQGVPHALIEVRNDLIETPETQAQWGQRLAQIMDNVLKAEGYL